MEDKLDHEVNNENGQKTKFTLLQEVKNTPKKKGKVTADPHSAEKTDGREKDGNETQQNGADKNSKKQQQSKVDEKELQKMIQEKITAIEGKPQVQKEDVNPLPALLNDKKKHEEADQLQGKLHKIYKNNDQDNKQKIAAMADLFNDEVIEFYRKSFTDIVSMSTEDITHQYLSEFHKERSQNADAILQKYTMLSKEYQNQSKDFKSKHDEITKQEQEKRADIIKKFEDHYENIKQQMQDEQQQLVDEDGNYIIEKETEKLQENYDDLIKQINEKEELMEKSLAEKETGKVSLKEQMENTLSSQQEQLQKEIQDYKDATEKKQKEEQELDNVLKQYKDRYQEFNQGLKQSRKAIQQQEKEVNYMSRTIQQLEETKRQTLLSNSPEYAQLLNSMDDLPAHGGGGGGGKGKNKKKKNKGGQSNAQKDKEDELVKKLEDQNKNKEKEIEQIKLDWEAEKAKLMEQKEALSKKCKEIQDKIKEKKAQ